MSNRAIHIEKPRWRSPPGTRATRGGCAMHGHWISATLDPRASLRAETDAEAVLASIGQVARPGPKVELLPGVMDEIIEALRGPFRLRIVYDKPDAPTRIVEPHGVLMGPRP